MRASKVVQFDVVGNPEFRSTVDYSSTGIELCFNRNTLTALRVVIEPVEGTTPDAMIAQARDRIMLLLALIEFRCGTRLQIDMIHIEETHVKSTVSHAVGSLGVDAVLAFPRSLPPQSVLSTLPPEAALQLGWHNSAKRSVWVIEKIRNYYEVLELESQVSKASQDSYVPPVEMSWLRDAVSHPRLTKNKDAIKFLYSNTGKDFIDPLDDNQLRFLEGEAERIRIEAELVLERKIPKWE